MKIYLDFNSTHPPDRDALAIGREFYFDHYENSSGLSLASQAVNKRIEEARDEIAALLGVQSTQVVFTSCATESNNLLIREFHRRRSGAPFRVLTSPFEHPSVAECLKSLSGTEITTLGATPDGTLRQNELAEKAAADLDLITLMAVQNESGIVLPVAEALKLRAGKPTPVLADFSQALPKLCSDGPLHLSPRIIAELTNSGAWLTATGHKIGAGFGAGLIITPPGATGKGASPLMAGGNQEFGMRAGTHNTEAIINLAEALKRKFSTSSYSRWQAVTAEFTSVLRPLLDGVAGATILGEKAERAPGTILLLLPGIPIDFLIMALDREQITVSTGTSCKSRSRSPSQAVIAMGYSNDDALSVVRLSFDQNLTNEQMCHAAKILHSSVQKLS